MKFNFDSHYAHKLSDNLYLCYVPDEATLDVDYIRTFGVPSTGFKDADEQLSSRKAKVMLNVSSILTYFMDGIDITIPNDDDIIEMHKNITGYLDEWREHLRTDINIRVTEYSEFLRGLEELNEALYGMIESDEYKELTEPKPEFYVPSFRLDRPKEEDVKIPSYRDKYDTMINVIRDREAFENN